MELNAIYPPLAAVLALVAALFLGRSVMRHEPGTARMVEISNAVKDGAMAFLNRQYKTIAYVAVAVILLFLGVYATRSTGTDQTLWLWTTIGFAVGAVFSALAGYIGMNIAVRANVRVANEAQKGLKGALDIAFRGGAVSGLAVAGLALLGVSGFYYLFAEVYEMSDPVGPLVGYAFGASLISLFARVGGGIYTKAADVGADLVGKVEAGIPEDDPRNPAVIADNVGDNVGDCAGMGADLFETYVVTVVAAVFLGFLLPTGAAADAARTTLVTYPLFLGAVAMLASIVGVFFVRLGKDNNIMKALYNGVYASIFVSVVGFWWVTQQMLGDINFTSIGLLGLGERTVTAQGVLTAAIIGLVVTLLLMYITEFYTSTKYRPVKTVAKSSQTGAATNIISGLAVGMESTFLPIIVLSLAVFGAFWAAGLYGIGIAAVAMLGITGMVVAMDTYGPITDNAGGIAEMAELPEATRKNTDALDAVGNTTKAVTKGYAIGSAALAALALFADYVHRLPTDSAMVPTIINDDGVTEVIFRLSDPLVLIGLLIGAMLPFLFSSFLMNAVGKAAGSVIDEVRRQFREIPGIMTGEGKPDYTTCVDIVTKSALKQMIVPGLLAVGAPLIVGLLFGPLALGGLLIGVLAGGIMQALSMANGGGAWDNAKKLIEDGEYGGKGSDAHAAAVVGDTVGDPYKDTAGPSLNALIKVINTVSLIFAGLIATSGGILLGL